MGERTGIGWTDSTFNPWIGCTKVGPGCDNCYAEALMDKRWHRVKWGSGAPRDRTSATNWRQPLLWEKEHEAFARTHGRRRRVFCASLADVFDNEVPAQWRVDLFNLITSTPHLDWLVLTKRIGNVTPLLRDMGALQLPRNVWIGATIVNQAEADRNIPKLMQVLAAVRFLSIEPMLGPVNVTKIPLQLVRVHDGKHVSGYTALLESGIDWVIVGGESGHNARPIEREWVESVRDQCEEAGVPFFFKQWGGKTPSAGGCELAGEEIKQWPAMNSPLNSPLESTGPSSS